MPSGKPTPVDIAKWFVDRFAATTRPDDGEMHQRLVELLRDDTLSTRLKNCAEREEQRKKLSALLAEPPQPFLTASASVSDRWKAAAPYAVGSLTALIHRAFARYARSPSLLDPLVYVTPWQDSESSVQLHARLNLHSRHDGIAALQTILDRLREEDAVPAASGTAPLTESALRMIPAPGDLSRYAFAAYWACRAVCNERDDLGHLLDLCRHMEAGYDTPEGTALRYQAMALLNRRDSAESSSRVDAYAQGRPSDLRVCNEAFRRAVHLGAFADAEAMVVSLECALRESGHDYQLLLFHLRLSRLRFEEGKTNEGMELLERTILALQQIRVPATVPKEEHDYAINAGMVIHAFWELCTATPHPDTDQQVILGLTQSLRSNQNDLTLLAVLAMAHRLQRSGDAWCADALTAYHYLWEAAVFRRDIPMMVRAWSGMSECTLQLDYDDDSIIIQYAESLAVLVGQMPGPAAEFWSARAFHEILHGRRDAAGSCLAKASECEALQGTGYVSPGLCRTRRLGVTLLAEGATRGLLGLLFDRESEMSLATKFSTWTAYREAVSAVQGSRGFFEWKVKMAEALVDRWRHKV